MAKFSLETLTASLGKDELNLARVQSLLKSWLPDGDDPRALQKLLGEMTANLGQPARKAIYAILCDQDNPLRQTLQTVLATEGVSAAVALLTPTLSAFAPAGVVIALATLIVKGLSTAADGAFCEELARLDPDRKDHAPRKTSAKPHAKPARVKAGADEKPRSSTTSTTPAAKDKPPKRKPGSDTEKTVPPPAAKPRPSPKAKKSPAVAKAEPIPSAAEKAKTPARPKKTPSSTPAAPAARKPRPKTTQPDKDEK
jgi:hypothetical protein